MYLCKQCNYATTTKLGKCPDCGSFGSFEKDSTKGVIGHKKNKHKVSSGTTLTSTHQSKTQKDRAISSPELQRLFPQGIKQAGIYLLGGEPGIGKSTIMLQIINELENNNDISLAYFSGEETAEQILSRNKRILSPQTDSDKATDVRMPREASATATTPENIGTNEISQLSSSSKEHEAGSPPDKGGKASMSLPNAGQGGLGDAKESFSIYHTTHLEDIITTTDENDHQCIIIDSIQTIYSESVDGVAGSPSQVKYCSEKLSEFTKQNNITCFVVGHVTKGGEIAGPKYLEHIVDVVLYLEGDRFGQYRFLRCRKNRFGSTDEVGIFEMGLFGLQPVYDLKERIVNQANVSIPGNVLTVGIDNGRAVLIHLEVLLNKTYGKFPQRIAQGIDPKRLQIICAILDRYLKLNLSYFDIYVNIPGEFNFRDNGLDLAVAAAIRSQSKNKIIDKQLVFIGELGLGGQVLNSKLHKKRLTEVKDFDIIDHERLKNIVELPNIV